MNHLDEKDLLGQETEHEWMDLANQFAELEFSEGLMGRGLTLEEFEQIRRTFNILNSKRKGRNQIFTDLI
jgi:hypothetical protein